MWTAVKLFLKGVPKEVWIGLAIIILYMIQANFWYRRGSSHVQQKWDAAKIEEQKKAAQVAAKQTAISEKVVTIYRDVVKKVYIKGDEIIKEVPVVITPEIDAKCVIPNGFVRLWNDSNKGQLSESARGFDEAPSEVKLSDVSTQKSRESTICTATEEQLIALQDWVRQQQAVGK